jgi:hypothetical protein
MPAARLSRRNLAPADLRKDAGGFDLPIALALQVAFAALWWLFTLARGCGPTRPTELLPTGPAGREQGSAP